MPSSIPYDHPSLVIGNIVDPAVLSILKNISKCQSKIDAAQDKLNAFILMKRSIAMTINELTDLNIDITELKNKQPEIDQSITQSASDYLSARIENETQILKLRAQLSDLETLENMESPLDLSLSQFKSLPLASESLKLDSQYFSFASSQQDDTIASIEKYVRDSTSNMASKSNEIAGAVSSQVSQQIQNHNISGTLIIAASCTHSYVKLFEPLVLDPDKTISIWNQVYASSKIDPEELKKSVVSGTSSQQGQSSGLSLLTGAGYGSSFIGMVHLLNSDANSIAPLSKIQGLLNEKLKIGGWLENATGGFGVDDSVLNEVKALLSTQSISAHVSVVVMGCIPSIASNQLKSEVNKLAALDPELISSITADETEIDTPDSDAEKAKTGARILNIQNSRVQNLMQGLSAIDQRSNSILDINSMMSTFENYIAAIKSKDETVGVPVSFHIRNLGKSEIEQLWQMKYYPQKEKNSSVPPEKND